MALYPDGFIRISRRSLIAHKVAAKISGFKPRWVYLYHDGFIYITMCLFGMKDSVFSFPRATLKADSVNKICAEALCEKVAEDEGDNTVNDNARTVYDGGIMASVKLDGGVLHS